MYVSDDGLVLGRITACTSVIFAVAVGKVRRVYRDSLK
jgi:hypothetical protein